MRSLVSVLLIALIGLTVPLGGRALAQGPCGEAVTVVAGNTLSAIARRCHSTVAAIVDANPEIENPDLGQSAGVGDLSWLSAILPAHVEARTDQYVAAFRYYGEVAPFSTAYMVRAVSPGRFSVR